MLLQVFDEFSFQFFDCPSVRGCPDGLELESAPLKTADLR